MLVGCQFSLYPMTDRYINVILGSVSSLDERSDLRVSRDEISTLVVGSPQAIFDAVLDCFVVASQRAQGHLVLSAMFSQGCPGEPDDEICRPATPTQSAACTGVESAPLEPSGVEVSAQFAVLPLGDPGYMDIIYREIATVKSSPLQYRAKNFCTRIDGDARAVFAAMQHAFTSAAQDVGHVVVAATISTGSPSAKTQ